MTFVPQAHETGADITSIAFSRDNNTLLTRGSDETLKVQGRRG